LKILLLTFDMHMLFIAVGTIKSDLMHISTPVVSCKQTFACRIENIPTAAVACCGRRNACLLGSDYSYSI